MGKLTTRLITDRPRSRYCRCPLRLVSPPPPACLHRHPRHLLRLSYCSPHRSRLYCMCQLWCRSPPRATCDAEALSLPRSRRDPQPIQVPPRPSAQPGPAETLSPTRSRRDPQSIQVPPRPSVHPGPAETSCVPVAAVVTNCAALSCIGASVHPPDTSQESSGGTSDGSFPLRLGRSHVSPVISPARGSSESALS